MRKLLGVTHVDSQAQVHLRNGSATRDKIAAQTSATRKRRLYTRSGHVPFYERGLELTACAVKRLGRLGEEGYDVITQVATHAAKGRDGG